MTKRTDGPSAAVRIRAMKRDRFKCTYCGTPGTDAELEVDHITPVSKGGSHHIANLTTACRACNQKKGAGTLAVHSAAPESKPHNGLIDMYLHTLDDEGKICWQGCICHVDGDVVLVQLFSWLDGRPTNIETMQKADVYDRTKTRLYHSSEAMISAYEHYDRRNNRRTA